MQLTVYLYISSFFYFAICVAGVGLHLHDTTLASVAWVVEELTYWENLYMCYTSEGQLLTKWVTSYFFSDVSETDNDYIYTYKDRNIDDDHDDIDDDYVMSMAVVMIMMAIIR